VLGQLLRLDDGNGRGSHLVF